MGVTKTALERPAMRILYELTVCPRSFAVPGTTVDGAYEEKSYHYILMNAHEALDTSGDFLDVFDPFQRTSVMLI